MHEQLTKPQTLDQQLERVIDDLMFGRLELWQLSPAVAGLYYLGEVAGRSQLERELVQTRSDRDTFYRIACRGGFGVPIIEKQGRPYWAILEARGQHEAAQKVRADMEALSFKLGRAS